MREYIRRLAELYVWTRAGKPADQDSWGPYLVHLRDTQMVVQEFLDTEPFAGTGSERYAPFPSLENYLSKTIRTLRQLDILKKFVRSPRSPQLFSLPFNILKQPSISTKSIVIPQTASHWEDVLDRAAGI
ncbi:uncharacterized protein ACHE_50933S [Aspergillus chevalieri]|uniref:Uncharacterized protein n=1 Tax=Aspergillus chevalieri TaxID=182096 RepID=A0A7R7ZPB6_ASPCH|nr:uncharacterized protein ACHE_50933S [Aspergillus chevalieri]BCR89735.1 hypothetical protein ACHE_50933S [Aspergillus chevalieri]